MKTCLIPKNFTGNGLSNCFCVFNKNQNNFIAYPTFDYSIEIYDISLNTISQSLKGHSNKIWGIKAVKSSFYNILISSSSDKSVRVWNVNSESFDLILVVKECHKSENIYSCCVLNNILITSAFNEEKMNIFDFNGNLLNTIGDEKSKTYSIDFWKDNKNGIFYLVNANNNDIKLYDIFDGKAVRTFKNSEDHYAFNIIDISNESYLIESNSGGINVWDIYTAKLTKKIGSQNQLIGIISWSAMKTIAASWDDGEIKVVSLIAGNINSSIRGDHLNYVSTVQKFNHHLYGESLLTGGWDNKICLWSIN